MEQEKIIDKIKKLFALAERVEGNESEALKAAEKAQELLIKYKLSQSEIQLNNPDSIGIIVPRMGKTIVANPFLRQNAKRNVRQNWFESLAEVMAESYFCKTSFNNQTGEVSFYGLDIDREITVFLFEKLADTAERSRKFYAKQEKARIGQIGVSMFSAKQSSGYKEWPGDDVFAESFHKGFRESIKESLSHFKVEIKDQALEKIDQDVLKFRGELVNNSGSYDWLRANKEDINLTKSFDDNDEYAIKIGLEAGKKASKISTKVNGNGTDLVKKSQEKLNYAGEVYLLIDCSGSMYAEKLDQAKSGAIEFAKSSLEKDFRIGLISFHSFAEHRIKPTDDIEKLSVQIMKMTDEGSTNMAEAIRTAMYQFSSHRIKRILCIVTDGMPDSVTDALAMANDAKRDNIEIMAIGTSPCNQEFLDQLTSKKGLGLLVGQESLEEGIKKMAGFLTA